MNSSYKINSGNRKNIIKETIDKNTNDTNFLNTINELKQLKDELRQGSVLKTDFLNKIRNLKNSNTEINQLFKPTNEFLYYIRGTHKNSDYRADRMAKIIEQIESTYPTLFNGNQSIQTNVNNSYLNKNIDTFKQLDDDDKFLQSKLKKNQRPKEEAQKIKDNKKEIDKYNNAKKNLIDNCNRYRKNHNINTIIEEGTFIETQTETQIDNHLSSLSIVKQQPELLKTLQHCKLNKLVFSPGVTTKSGHRIQGSSIINQKPEFNGFINKTNPYYGHMQYKGNDFHEFIGTFNNTTNNNNPWNGVSSQLVNGSFVYSKIVNGNNEGSTNKNTFENAKDELKLIQESIKN